MADKERQIQSLIREFKSNQLQYQDQICALLSRNKIQQLQIEELKTFINIYRTKECESIDKQAMTTNLQEISKKILSTTEAQYDYIIEIMNEKIIDLINRLIDCEKSISFMKQSDTMIANQQLKKQLSKKNNQIKAQNQFIEKIINEKSESQAIFNRQIIFLERLANEKKQLCNRLQSINTYLMDQNTQLKKERDMSRKSSVCKFVSGNDREITIKTSDNFNRSGKLKDELRNMFVLESRAEDKTSKLNVSNGSKTKISLHIDRKLLDSKSKEKQNQMPFSQIKNQIDSYNYK